MSAHEEHLSDVLAASAAPSTVAAPTVPTETAAKTAESAMPTTGSLALLAELARIGETVSELAAALGVPLDRLGRSEALDRVELDTALPVEALAAWEPAACARWFVALGDDLRLDLRLTGSDAEESGPVCTLRVGRSPEAALASFVSAAEIAAKTASDDVQIEIRLGLAKSRATGLVRDLLALRSGGPTPSSPLGGTRAVVFYTTPAWNRLVTFSALADWERLGILRDDCRTVVVLCESAGYLAGPALEVLGARQAEEPRWLAPSPAAWRRFQQRAHEVRGLRDEEGNWPSAPRTLTPAHLNLESRQPGLDATERRLAALRAALAAAYLASSVQSASGSAHMLRFAGARPATCSIGEIPAESARSSRPSPSRIPAKTAESAFPDAAPAAWDALARLATWAYNHASPDKLAIARECLARELPAGRDVTLAEVAAAASAALEAAKANFVLYLRHNSERYFRVRQQALDAVSTYTAGVRKAVSDLTGDVVNNVYRTVGLLAAVVIAGLIQPSLSLAVARLAAGLYTLYIVFVLTYLISARERHYYLETADLDARLAAMPELSESERRRLRTQPSPERAYFERYFLLSRAIYIALAALGLLFFLLLWTPLGAHLFHSS